MLANSHLMGIRQVITVAVSNPSKVFSFHRGYGAAPAARTKCDFVDGREWLNAGTCLSTADRLYVGADAALFQLYKVDAFTFLAGRICWRMLFKRGKLPFSGAAVAFM